MAWEFANTNADWDFAIIAVLLGLYMLAVYLRGRQ